MESILALLGPFKIEGIASCLLCGTLIGLERQLLGKPAGIRTSILICFSTYMFAALSSFLIRDQGDPPRVVGQVVTGVGFLGGGVMLTRDGLVVGVTSAAIICLLATLGCIIAFGFELQAIIFTIISILVLVGVGLLEQVIKKLKSGVHKDEKDA
jgi:putative Mg2+ transporter-C (MgtC) family protein